MRADKNAGGKKCGRSKMWADTNVGGRKSGAEGKMKDGGAARIIESARPETNYLIYFT